MPELLPTNPDNQAFLDLLIGLEVGDTVEVADGVLEVEAITDRPTHFLFHQRIFPAGMLLRKVDSKVRIFIEAEKLGLQVVSEDHSEFDDNQITAEGVVLQPER